MVNNSYRPKYKCSGCNTLHSSRNMINVRGKILCFYCRKNLPSYKLQDALSTQSVTKQILDKKLNKLHPPFFNPNIKESIQEYNQNVKGGIK